MEFEIHGDSVECRGSSGGTAGICGAGGAGGSSKSYNESTITEQFEPFSTTIIQMLHRENIRLTNLILKERDWSNRLFVVNIIFVIYIIVNLIIYFGGK